jgi:hypothetical protein
MISTHDEKKASSWMTYMRKNGSQQMMKVPTMTAMVRATFFSCTGLNVQQTELE